MTASTMWCRQAAPSGRGGPEIDDEDPIFTHLESAAPIRNYGWPRDLPRAVGQ